MNILLESRITLTLKVIGFVIVYKVNSKTLTVTNHINNMNILVIKSRNIRFLPIPIRES